MQDSFVSVVTSIIQEVSVQNSLIDIVWQFPQAPYTGYSIWECYACVQWNEKEVNDF